MKAGELRELLAVLTEAAPGLRAAGVASIKHGALQVDLAPPPVPPPVVLQAAPAGAGRDAVLQALVDLAAKKGQASK